MQPFERWYGNGMIRIRAVARVLVQPLGASAFAEQCNAVDAFGPEPVRFPMFVWALAQLIAVVRRP